VPVSGSVKRAYSAVFLCKILFHKGDAFHPELLAVEVGEDPGVGGEIEAEIVAVKSLTGLSVFPVHLAPAVFSVAQQRVSGVGEGGADLMGAACEQLRLHQREGASGLQGLVERLRGLAAGDRVMVYADELFPFVLQEEALQLAFRRRYLPQRDAEVLLYDLPVADLGGKDAQRLGVFGGDDDAAGVAVDPVAQRRGEGILPLGVPLPLLIQIGLHVVDEGVDLFRLIGVNHQTGPLVQQEDVFVLVENVQFGLEKGQEEVILPGLLEKFVVDIQLQHIAGLQPLIPLTALSVALDALDADVFLQQRDREQGHRLGKEAVQPLTCVIFSDGEFTHRRPPESIRCRIGGADGIL